MKVRWGTVCDGVNYEDELKKSKEIKRKFRKDCKLAYEDHVNLKWESECTEKCYKTLVEKLKRKICADLLVNKENEQLEGEIR